MPKGTFIRTETMRLEARVRMMGKQNALGHRHTDAWRAAQSAARCGRLLPRLAPTERATPGDFRWAAGFYEGEGTARHSSQSTNVAIAQKDPWALERMRALFGGSIGTPYPDGCHRWNLSGARARGFLLSIYGLLSPRRQEQARKALGL